MRAIGHDPPAPIRRARQVAAEDMEKRTAERLQTAAWPKITMMTVNHRRRQQPFGEQASRPVEIGQDRIEQSRALFHRVRQEPPLVGSDH